MTYENEPTILRGDSYSPDYNPGSSKAGDLHSGELSFEAVLDEAFERLRDMHNRYCIRRIGEMDEELKSIEKDLDEFIGKKVCSNRADYE